MLRGHERIVIVRYKKKLMWYFGGVVLSKLASRPMILELELFVMLFFLMAVVTRCFPVRENSYLQILVIRVIFIISCGQRWRDQNTTKSSQYD